MDLTETTRALEAKGVIVAIDLGVHGYCELNSNCPIAIQLRRLIADAGITLEQLLEGFEEATVVSHPVSHDIPSVDANLTVQIAGKNIDIDFKDAVSGQLREGVVRKLGEIDSIRERVRLFGNSLFNTYAHEISRRRDSRTLPQLSYSSQELIRANCLITCLDRTYLFLFPVKYNPQYIVDNGIRYLLLNSDTEALKADIYLSFAISQENKILRAVLLDGSGAKFQHYHGNSNEDCWGTVVIPPRWDGALAFLSVLRRSLMMSLTTINYNSLLVREPPGFPPAVDLLGRSTELGREGETEPHLAVEEQEATGRQGWGRTPWDGRQRGRDRGEPEVFIPGTPPLNIEITRDNYA